MELNFFKGQNFKSAQEVKHFYYELAKKNHPDMGGSNEVMKQINAEFEFIMLKGLEAVNNMKFEDEAMKKAEVRSWQDYKEFADILSKIINLPISIEIIGSWVWLSGCTYDYKEVIKAAGFKFSAKKQAWYWYKGMSLKSFYKGRYSMNEIRSRFGSVMIDSEGQGLLSVN
jgi:hypothetical protein